MTVKYQADPRYARQKGTLDGCAYGVTIERHKPDIRFHFRTAGICNGVFVLKPESYGAFGLLVTLVWLYQEILRLLGKMRD